MRTAAPLPRFRSWKTTFTPSGQVVPLRSSRVPSVDPSSTTTSSRLATGSSAVSASSIAASTVERSLNTGMRIERPPAIVLRVRPSAPTSYRYGVRRDAAEDKLARRSDDRLGRGVRLQRVRRDRDGLLQCAKRRAVELTERGRDVDAERHRQLERARIDLEPAAARVLPDAIDLERRRSGSRREERSRGGRG